MFLIDKFKTELVSFLTGKPAAALSMKGSVTTAADAVVDTRTLSISMIGSPQFYIAAPDGLESGIKNGDILYDIPGSNVQAVLEMEQVTVSDPVDGIFTTQVTLGPRMH